MNDQLPTPHERVTPVYAPAAGRTSAGTHEWNAAILNALAEQAGAAPSIELPEFVPAGSSAEAENQHLHHVEQDSANNPKRVAAHAALVASGDTAKLHTEYVATIAELQAWLTEMADAGYTVSAEIVAVEVSVGQTV